MILVFVGLGLAVARAETACPAPAPHSIAEQYAKTTGTPVLVIDGETLDRLGLDRDHTIRWGEVQRIVDSSGLDAHLHSPLAKEYADTINQRSPFAEDIFIGTDFETDHPEQFPQRVLAVVVAVFDDTLTPQMAIDHIYGADLWGVTPQEILTRRTTAQIDALAEAHEIHHGNDAGMIAASIEENRLAEAGDKPDQITYVGWYLAAEQEADLGAALHAALQDGDIEVVRENADIRALNSFFAGREAAYRATGSDDLNRYRAVYYDLSPALDRLDAYLRQLPPDQWQALRGLDRSISEHCQLTEDQLRRLGAIIGKPGAGNVLQATSLAAFEDAVTEPFRSRFTRRADGSVDFEHKERYEAMAKGDFSMFSSGPLVERAKLAETRLLAPLPGGRPRIE